MVGEIEQKILAIAAAGKDALVDVMLDGRPPAEKMVLRSVEINRSKDGETVAECRVIDLCFGHWYADVRHVSLSKVQNL